MKIVQEKFQLVEPANPEDSESTGWMSDKSARVKKGAPCGGKGVMLQSLPQGMDIDDQENADIRQEPSVIPGESDDSHDVLTPKAARRGFRRLTTEPTDGNVGGELFYADISAEDSDGGTSTGFLERGNMLDRN